MQYIISPFWLSDSNWDTTGSMSLIVLGTLLASTALGSDLAARIHTLYPAAS